MYVDGSIAATARPLRIHLPVKLDYKSAKYMLSLRVTAYSAAEACLYDHYLIEETRVLREQLSSHRMRFSDDQRRAPGRAPGAGAARSRHTTLDCDAPGRRLPALPPLNRLSPNPLAWLSDRS